MKLSSVKRRAAIFIVNHFFAGTRFFEYKRNLLNSVGYEIGENSKVVAPIYCTGKLKVGQDCWVGKNLIVNGNGTVTIGDRCDIAPEVTFLTGGHEIGTVERRAGKGQTYHITVGDGVWLGARSTILGDTTIGSSAIVASCACVAHDVKDNVLVGGVPAKVIRELEQ